MIDSIAKQCNLSLLNKMRKIGSIVLEKAEPSLEEHKPNMA
jgi:hypothetical protein